MVRVVLLGIVLLSLMACGSESKSETSAVAMPEEMKESIKRDLAEGYALNSVFRTGGTGTFAKSNGGEITMVKQEQVKVYTVDALWVEEAEAFVDSLK